MPGSLNNVAPPSDHPAPLLAEEQSSKTHPQDNFKLQLQQQKANYEELRQIPSNAQSNADQAIPIAAQGQDESNNSAKPIETLPQQISLSEHEKQIELERIQNACHKLGYETLPDTNRASQESGLFFFHRDADPVQTILSLIKTTDALIQKTTTALEEQNQALYGPDLDQEDLNVLTRQTMGKVRQALYVLSRCVGSDAWEERMRRRRRVVSGVRADDAVSLFGH